MYIPNDIWIYIKSYMFKTKHMKNYDNVMKEFIEMKRRAESLVFHSYDQFLYDSWPICKKIKFVNNFLYKEYILHT